MEQCHFYHAGGVSYKPLSLTADIFEKFVPANLSSQTDSGVTISFLVFKGPESGTISKSIDGCGNFATVERRM
jgi:hypothetical protein